MTNEVGLAVAAREAVRLHCQSKAVCLVSFPPPAFRFSNRILCVSRQTALEFAFAFSRAWQKAKHSDKRLQTRQCDNASNKPRSAETLKLINWFMQTKKKDSWKERRNPPRRRLFHTGQVEPLKDENKIL